MEKAIRKMLLPGVFLTYLKTSKFKTCYLSMNLLRPLGKDSAAKNALVPNVLRRGTKNHPDMESISSVLDGLYGARVETAVRKKGEVQCVGFAADFIDDKYTPDNEKLFERVAEFMGKLLLKPVIDNNGFRTAYFDGEKHNLITEIEAQINDKRLYAQTRLIELMCGGEAYGTDRLGSRESAAALQRDDVYKAYGELLRTSEIELFFCGSLELDRVCDGLTAAFDGLPRDAGFTAVGTELILRAAAPKTVTETMDVTQGKLVMGFRTGTGADDPLFPALMLLNTAYGGSTTAKLFMNVREAMSLCYYASSSIEKHKGLMLVSSGIEFKDFELARDEILRQLDACRAGSFEDWELEGARSYIMTMLRTTEDSPARLEDFYLGQAVSRLSGSPSELAGLIKVVAPEQVVDAASRICLDTIYFLKG